MKRIGWVFALAVVAGCGKEAGRVAFSSDGTGAATMTLKAGDVDFWTDIDLSYEGNAALAYRVTLEQGGKSVATTVCDPLARLNVKTMWTETNVGASHSRHGMGKMSCTVTLPSGGATEVHATLAWSAKPSSVTLKKADLVVKQ
ncbi:MAG TPA: hypothetical protein VGH28_29425 [Polyangiaceae bacterium]|jgi:hypothetical protein